MNCHLTEIACIIDRSGSMEDLRDTAIHGFNTFLEAQQAAPGEARMTLVLFSDAYHVVHESADIRLVPPLTHSTYVPDGTTALLDAVGRTVDDLGTRLDATGEAHRPGKVVVAILTDGLENASRHYSWPEISDRIAHQQSVYGWEFLFLGANQDAIATAAQISVPAANAHTWDATPEGMRAAMDVLCCEVAARRTQ